MKLYKYPSTYHLPTSPNVGREDRVLDSDEHLQGMSVIVTEKYDGENTTIMREKII